MNSLPILGAALGLAAVLGAAERAALASVRRSLPIRVQVNGTRGKSTTTRLIRAALAEGGIPCLSKSTGTAARYVLPDGREEPLRRRAAPNIREQIAAVFRARREKAGALVVECMALKPELQWASERLILRSTIGVITNARLDHVEVMGQSRAEIARSLGNSIPERGVLVVGEAFLAEALADRARALGTELVLAPPLSAEARAGAPAWWAEDAAMALEVARRCGIDEATALRGMRRAMPDPGAVRELELPGGARALDASAANDPESLLELLEADGGRGRPLLLVYNHRADRSARLASFLSADLPGELLVTGDAPGGTLLRRLARGGKAPAFVPRRGLEAALAARLGGGGSGGTGGSDGRGESGRWGAAPRVVLCGNTKGWPLPGAGIAPEKERA